MTKRLLLFAVGLGLASAAVTENWFDALSFGVGVWLVMLSFDLGNR